MSNKGINFDSFKVTGNNVLVEVPTKSKNGIYIVNDKKTTEGGWFKVRKVGKQVMNEDIVPGAQAMVYFHHEPYRFNEVIFMNEKDQETFLEEMDAQEEKPKLVIADGLGSLREHKPYLHEYEYRQFLLVREHDILFTR